MIDKNLLGPQSWREYPTFWIEGVKFKFSVMLTRFRRWRA